MRSQLITPRLASRQNGLDLLINIVTGMLPRSQLGGQPAQRIVADRVAGRQRAGAEQHATDELVLADLFRLPRSLIERLQPIYDRGPRGINVAAARRGGRILGSIPRLGQEPVPPPSVAPTPLR